MKSNIPFIHNYCDRWCERCPFTSRCAVYKSEQELTDEQRDIENPAFMQKILEDLKILEQSLSDESETLGLYHEALSDEENEEVTRKMQRVDAMVECEELIDAVDQYSKAARKLLSDFPFWTEMAKRMAKETALGIGTQQGNFQKVKKIDQCRDIISWYHFFLGPKFRRAVSGQLEDLEENRLQSDWNGSAKVAMIAVSLSKDALTTIFELTGKEDELLPLLSLITTIQDLAKRKFPHADKFIRPGFDEVKPELN
jgi:hypothetical protein